MHDRHTGGPGGIDHPLGVGQHVGLVHHVFDRAVQDAALGGEVVLVLDQHHGGGLGVDRHAGLLFPVRGHGPHSLLAKRSLPSGGRSI